MKNLPWINIEKHGIYKSLFLTGLIGGLWLKMIYTQYTIKINKVPIFDESNHQMFLMTFLSAAFLILILALIDYKEHMVLPVVGAVFLGFVLLADTLYGRYYYNPVSMSIFDQLYMAGDVSGSALSLFKIKDIIFFLDFPVLYVFGRIMNVKEVRKRPVFRTAVLLVLMVTVLSAFVWKYNETDKTHYAYEHKYIARDMGLFFYHGKDIMDYTDRRMGIKVLASEEQTLIQELNRYDGDNDFTGLAEGYNVIVIQLEAIMGFLVDYEVEGQKVMPFLSALKDESLYLNNCYIQTANGNTVDAELLMNTSLLPSQSGAVYYEYPTNDYISLPRLLDKKGYVSNSFHAYEASFWNREVMHKTLGFDRFYSLDDFNLDHKVGWSLGDEFFYKQALEKTLADSQGKPFYSFMIALSSHHPFDAFITGPFSHVQASDGLLNHYYNAAAYADSAIESMVNRLKEEGLYDNTVLVIYGDHGALFNEDGIKQSQLDGVPYTPYNWIKYQQVPAVIHAPGIFDEGLLVDQVTGQSDLMPTLSNLLGLQGLYTLGGDVLSENYESLVVKRYGDVITNDFIYISDSGEVYDYATGEVLEKEDHREEILEAHSLLTANDLIMISDYFEGRLEK